MDISCRECVAQLDSFLENTLTEEKREIIELHYFQCDDCFAQLQAREPLHNKEVHIVAANSQQKSIGFKFWSLKPVMAVGALVVIVFTSFLAINGFNKAARRNYLYAITDVPAPAYMTSETRSRDINEGESSQHLFKDAMSLYNKKQYSHALMILNKIPQSENNPRVSFFKAICYFYMDELKAAEALFDHLIAGMDPSYYDETIFYKSLALLRMGKKKAALDQLVQLSEMFSPLAPKAKELILKLN
jgi:tetratricopeptide (TPR) repeat protein